MALYVGRRGLLCTPTYISPRARRSSLESTRRALSPLRTWRYPCVMGHEIVDVVIQAGHKVKDLQVGDHVSIGALVSACLNKDPKAPCSVCASGNDAYCPHRV
ncbi:hypothetical protein PR002_g22923 [Phytophthora rubi]|uniref:Alcohol dehydrogenase-like N-terminal domain-containing protein n=1 Tax=Phytophthora rubi TaxID=129364 RepID=A0A6A3IRT2_9STRA|nr:hypothetical protein PR002_g22923 [Phytophthora rubi]